MWYPEWDPGTEKGLAVKKQGNLNRVQPLINNISVLVHYFDKRTILI